MINNSKIGREDITLNGWKKKMDGKKIKYHYDGDTILHKIMAIRPSNFNKYKKYIDQCLENKVIGNDLPNRIIYNKFPQKIDTLISPLHVAAGYGNFELLEYYKSKNIEFQEVENNGEKINQKNIIENFLMEKQLLERNEKLNVINNFTKDNVNATDLKDRIPLELSMRPLLSYCLILASIIFKETFHERFVDVENGINFHDYSTLHHNFINKLKSSTFKDRPLNFSDSETLSTNNEQFNKMLFERYYKTSKFLIDNESDIEMLPIHYVKLAKFIKLSKDQKTALVKQKLHEIHGEKVEENTKPKDTDSDSDLTIKYFYLYYDHEFEGGVNV